MISIGIHIHSQGFNVVELDLHRGSLKIKNSHNHVFVSQSQEEHKQIIILEYLQTLEEKYRNEPVRFCYGLAQNQVSGFSIEFPFKEKFKILKTLPFQIEDKSPFRSDKTFYDGRITKITNNNSYVTCFVTPESNIQDFLKFSESLKTKPYLLSVEGIALMNIISGWNYNATKSIRGIKNALYIYLGFHGSIVLVFKEGHLNSISNLEWGAASIIEQMSNKYKLSLENSIDQFFEKSFILTSQKGFTKEQVFFSDLIEKELKSLIHQFKLLKLSLETESKIKFQENFIFGPASVIKNLSAYLSTESSSYFSRLKNLRDIKTFDLSESKNQNLLIPIGLAMEGFKRPPYGGVNFLHSLNKQNFQLIPKKWKSTFIGFFMILFLFSVYVFIRNQESLHLVDKMQDVFVDYGKKIASLRKSQVSVDKVKGYLEDKEVLLEVEKLIKEKVSKESPMNQLKIVTEAIDVEQSSQLKITYLKIKDRRIFIRGSIHKDFLSTLKSQLQKISKNKIKKLKDIKAEESNEKKMKLKKMDVKNATSKDATSKDVTSEDVSSENVDSVEEEKKLPLEKFAYEFIIKEDI